MTISEMGLALSLLSLLCSSILRSSEVSLAICFGVAAILTFGIESLIAAASWLRGTDDKAADGQNWALSLVILAIGILLIIYG